MTAPMVDAIHCAVEMGQGVPLETPVEEFFNLSIEWWMEFEAIGWAGVANADG